MSIAPQTSVDDTQGPALSGQLHGFVRGALRSYTSEEDPDTGAELAFGTLVCLGTDEDGGMVKATAAALPAGVVVHSHKYAKPQELGDVGLKSGVTAHVLRKGTVWVVVEEAVDPGDAVRVRLVATSPEVYGAFRTQADGTDCAVLAEACWLTSTSGAGVALLEIDLTTQGALTADT
jgi:hypothetical protein